jgi:shikimate dehydrogenase
MSLDRVVQPLVACLGNPVGGNPTQFVMTRLVREAELDWRFFTSEVPLELFETAFRGIQALGMSGAAILPPFQKNIESFLGSLTTNAKALGVVEVVKWESDQWIGDETLSQAILRSVVHKVSSMVTLQEVDSEQAFSPQSIGVVGRPELVQALRASLSQIPGDYAVVEFQPGETPPDERPLKALIIEQFDAIMKMGNQARVRLFKDTHWAQNPMAVFVPPATGWIEASKERSLWIEEFESRNIDRIDELDVLTHQFAINFEFWTGYEASMDSIRESLEEYLQW